MLPAVEAPPLMKRSFASILLLSQALFFSAAPARCETPASDSQGRFDLVAAPTTAAQWDGIKFDRVTGQTWMAIKGKWVLIPEKDPLPKSLYKIIMIPLRSDFEAVRLDTHSGKSWRLQAGNWQSMD